jgi:hypothetical protein
MSSQLDDPRHFLLFHGELSFQELDKPQSHADKVLYYVQRGWIEFCHDNSISNPATEFHENKFLRYLLRNNGEER